MNFKKIFVCCICCCMALTVNPAPVNAVDPSTVAVIATEILRAVPEGISFIFDKCGKLHAIAAHNDEVKKYEEEKRAFSGLRTLQDIQSMLIDVVNGVSPIPVYGQESAKRQCFDAVSGCIARIKTTDLEKKGSIIYMIGPSGTGKTTMAKAIANAFLKNSDHTCCFIECSQISKDTELGTQLFKTVNRPANLCPKKEAMGFWQSVATVFSGGDTSDPMSKMGTYTVPVAAPVLSHILKWDGNAVIIIDEFDKMKRLCSTQSYDGEPEEDKSADEILKSISSNGYYMMGDTKIDSSNVLFIITTNESRENLERNFGQYGVKGGGVQRLNIIEFDRLDDDCSKRIIDTMLEKVKKALTNRSGDFKLKSVTFSDQTLLKDSEAKQGRAKDDLWDSIFGLCVRELDKLQYQSVELIFNQEHSFEYRIIPNPKATKSMAIVDFSDPCNAICDFSDECLVDYSS